MSKAARECYCNSKRHSPKAHPVKGCIVAGCCRAVRRREPLQHEVLALDPTIGWHAEAWSYTNPRTRHVYVRVVYHGESTTLNFKVPR